jgi:hypothetical protein
MVHIRAMHVLPPTIHIIEISPTPYIGNYDCRLSTIESYENVKYISTSQMTTSTRVEAKQVLHRAVFFRYCVLHFRAEIISGYVY